MKTHYSEEDFLIVDGKLIEYKGKDGIVIIPDCVTVVGTHSLGYYVKKVVFPASVIKIEPVPFICNMRLEEIEVDKDNPFYYSQDNCLIERPTKKLIKATTLSVIPQDGSVTTIAEYAFADVDCAQFYIRNCITEIESHAFGGNSEVTLYIEAKSKPEGWADDWDNGEGELWDEVWWECGPGLLLEWGTDFKD